MILKIWFFKTLYLDSSKDAMGQEERKHSYLHTTDISMENEIQAHWKKERTFKLAMRHYGSNNL